jgi:hypothetical protein
VHRATSSDARRRRACALVAALIVLHVTRPAGGEPIKVKSPSTLRTDKGSEVRLPPGVFLSQPEYDELDVEVRRLQDAETRLRAENISLRNSLRDTPSPWIGLVGVALTGITILVGACISR